MFSYKSVLCVECLPLLPPPFLVSPPHISHFVPLYRFISIFMSCVCVCVCVCVCACVCAHLLIYIYIYVSILVYTIIIYIYI